MQAAKIPEKRTIEELAKALKSARGEIEEYREMLNRAREENVCLKQEMQQANFRGQQVRNFLYSLKYQSASMNQLFGVTEEKTNV